MTKADIDCIIAEKQTWRCPPCSKLRRKSMEAVSAAEEGTANFSQVIFMLEEAREDRKRLEREFNKSFEFAHSKIDDQTKMIVDQTQQLKDCLKFIEELKQENLDLKRKVVDLEVRLEEVEQYTRANTIEIFGVPEPAGTQVNEDVYETVRKVCVALNLEMSREKIDVCHRLRKPRDERRPAGIIARFVRREDKMALLKARKVKRNFSTSHLGYDLPAAVPVYINECLSPARRKLYNAAREVKAAKEYTYLWIQNGKILMRREQGAPVVRISSFDDLAKL